MSHDWLGIKEVKLFLDLVLVSIIYGNYCSVVINPLMPYHTQPSVLSNFWPSRTIPLQKGLKDSVHDHTESRAKGLRKGKAKKATVEAVLSRHTVSMCAGNIQALKAALIPNNYRPPSSSLQHHSGVQQHCITGMQGQSHPCHSTGILSQSHSSLYCKPGTSKSHKNISYPSNP